MSLPKTVQYLLFPQNKISAFLRPLNNVHLHIQSTHLDSTDVLIFRHVNIHSRKQHRIWTFKLASSLRSILRTINVSCVNCPFTQLIKPFNMPLPETYLFIYSFVYTTHISEAFIKLSLHTKRGWYKVGLDDGNSHNQYGESREIIKTLQYFSVLSFQYFTLRGTDQVYTYLPNHLTLLQWHICIRGIFLLKINPKFTLISRYSLWMEWTFT